MPGVPEYGTRAHERLIRQVTDRFIFSENGKRARDNYARRAYKHFRAFIDETNWQFQTKIYEPKLFADTMSQVAREMQAIFQVSPIFRYLPQGSSDYDQAEQMTHAAAHFLDLMDSSGILWSRYASACLQRRLYGTAWYHTCWRLERRKVEGWHRRPLEDPLTGQPFVNPVTGETIEQEVYERALVTAYDGPWFRTLHWSEAFPDHQTENMRDEDLDHDAWFVMRVMRPRAYLKRMGRKGAWPAAQVRRAVASAPRGAALETLFETLKWQNQVGLVMPITQNLVEARDWYEVMECWTPDRVTTMVNRSFIMEDRPNPFAHGRMPFGALRNYYVPGESYGMSDFELSEKLHTALQDMRNAGATTAMLTAFPIIKYGPDVDPRQLRHGLGAKWRVGGSKSVLEFVHMPAEGLQVASMMEEGLRSAIDATLGTSDVYRGSTPEDPNTKATAITLALQQAGLRTQFAIDTIDHGMTRPLADDWQHLIRQFCSPELVTAAVGDPQAPPVSVDVAALRRASFSTVPTASSALTRMLEEKRIQQLYQTVVQGQEPNVDRRELVRMLLDIVAPRYARRLLAPEGQPGGAAPAPGQPMTPQQAGAMGVPGSAAVQGRVWSVPSPPAPAPQNSLMEEVANEAGAEAA